MKSLVKFICCILTVLLFFYLVFIDYPKMVASMNPRVSEEFESMSLEKDSSSFKNETFEAGGDENESSLKDLEKKSKEIDEQIKELKKQQASSGCFVNLFFDQVFESGYEQLFPLMKEKGVVGTLVLTDGKLPGDNLQMTENQCLEMLNAGWELAVGGSEDIDMTGNLQTVLTEWSSYLTDYIAQIKLRLNRVPTTYCFNEGEYREEFDVVLKEFGFKKIRYYGDASLEGNADGLIKIRGYRVSQNSDTEDVIKNLKEYSSVALSTRRVTKEIENPSRNIEIDKYESILDAIQKEDSMCIVGSDEEKEFVQKRDTLEEQITELEREKEKIDKQIDSM